MYLVSTFFLIFNLFCLHLGAVDFTVTIQRSSGFFEVMESGAAIVTGKVFVPEDVTRESSGLQNSTILPQDDDVFVMKPKDIYKELRLRGYNYKGLFRSIMCCNSDGLYMHSCELCLLSTFGKQIFQFKIVMKNSI